MKSVFLFLATVFTATSLFAQAPAIQWQHAYGGSCDDNANCIKQTLDGGYIFCGSSCSTNGDVTGNHGGSDCWIVKLSATGAIEWQKSIGGSGDDAAFSIVQLPDSSYVFAGGCKSNDGDATLNHGQNDFWVVKLSSSGAIIWQHSYGGSLDDQAKTICQTLDGGFIVTGTAESLDGDITGHIGLSDVWTLKLSSTGALQWQKTHGSYSYDNATDIFQAPDSTYIITAYTDGSTVDISGNHGNYDGWIMKMSSTGSLLWQRCLGGSMGEYAWGVIPYLDGTYRVIGDAQSDDMDVSGNHGGSDAWLTKISAAGSLLGQKCLGGSRVDEGHAIYPTVDSGFIIAAESNSSDGDVSHMHGGGYLDYWIVKMSAADSIEWEKNLGGSNSDMPNKVLQTSDSGYIVAGNSRSSDGDVTGAHGAWDGWIVKLKPVVSTLAAASVTSSPQINISPNPANSSIIISSTESIYEVAISDLTGRMLYATSCSAAQVKVNVTDWPAGIYFVRLNSFEVRKFVISR